MKKYVIILGVFSFCSCKKNDNLVIKNATQHQDIKKNNDSIIQFKTIGNIAIKNFVFPKEWSVNTYDDESIKLKKEDIDAQKKLEEVDYFNKIKGSKNENLNSNFSNFIKKDSLLNIAKVDSLFVIDSKFFDSDKKLLFLKTISTLDNGEYDSPINIYKIDMVLFNKTIPLKSINIYSEIDYPSETKQKICYLDQNGKLYCKQLKIEEGKVLFKSLKEIDTKKIFNLK